MCDDYKVVVHNGLRIHDIDSIRKFVDLFADELKRLGIEYVYVPENCTNTVYELYENTLFVRVERVWLEGRYARASARKRIKVRGFMRDMPYFNLHFDDAVVFDVIIYIDEWVYNRKYNAVLAYSKRYNTFILPWALRGPQTERLFLEYMRIAVAIAEGRPDVAEPAEPVDPYRLLGEVVLNWPVTVLTGRGPLLNTAVCRENNVDVRVSSEDIVVRVSRRGRNRRVTRGGRVYELPKEFEYEYSVVVRYGLDGEPVDMRGRGRIIFDGQEFLHPNISEAGSVCLGTARLPQLDMHSELCSQAAEVAKILEDVLSMPEIGDAYNPEFGHYLIEQYGGGMRQVEW